MRSFCEFVCVAFKSHTEWSHTQCISVLTNTILPTIVGARGVMVIVVGNEHGDTSSNPGWDWLHFT